MLNIETLVEILNEILNLLRLFRGSIVIKNRKAKDSYFDLVLDRIDGLTKRVESAKDALEVIANEFRSKDREITRLKDENTRLQQLHAAEIQRINQTHASQILSEKSNSSYWEGQYNTLRTNYGVMSDQKDAIISDLQQQLGALPQENADMKVQLDEMRIDALRNSSQQSGYEARALLAEGELNKRDQLIKAHEDTIARLTEEVRVNTYTPRKSQTKVLTFLKQLAIRMLQRHGVFTIEELAEKCGFTKKEIPAGLRRVSSNTKLSTSSA